MATGAECADKVKKVREKEIITPINNRQKLLIAPN
jgi:hypothetical protein